MPNPLAKPPKADLVLAELAALYRPDQAVSLNQVGEATGVSQAAAGAIRTVARAEGRWPYAPGQGGWLGHNARRAGTGAARRPGPRPTENDPMPESVTKLPCADAVLAAAAARQRPGTVVTLADVMALAGISQRTAGRVLDGAGRRRWPYPDGRSRWPGWGHGGRRAMRRAGGS